MIVSEAVAELAAVRARMVALAAELAAARRELYSERALRAHPTLTPEALDFVTATDEAGFMSQAAKLAAHLSRP